MFILGFPLLLVPFAIYNIIAFLMPSLTWTGQWTYVHMISGGDWTMSAGDMLITLAILLLFGEMMKSTRIGIRTVVDHALSLILFLGMLVEFLLVKQAASSTFFLLLVGEMMKSTRIGIRTVVDHALSLILFLGMLVEFLLVKQAASSTFFLLLV